VLVGAPATVTFQATRSSPTHVNGSIRFGTGVSVDYDGTLVDSMRINGSAIRIDGSIMSAEGSTCALGLVRGLVP